MNANYELPNPGSSFQQAQTVLPERPSCQIDRIQHIGALRRANGLEAIIRRIVSGISRWHRRGIAIRQLRSLGDQRLADIGLDRSQIVSTVDKMIKAGDPSA